MAQRTADQNETALDLVEDMMLRGHDRPNPIKKRVNEQLAVLKIPRIGDKRTLQHMMDQVRARWQRRTGKPEETRQQLLAEAEVAMQEAYTLLDGAKAQNNQNAQVGALRTVIAAQQRRARLLGLDKVNVNIGVDEAQLEEIRKKRLEEALSGVNADPIRDLYLRVPPDSGQGHGSADSAEPASGAKEAPRS